MVVSPRQLVIFKVASMSDSESVSTAIIGSGRPASRKRASKPLPHQFLPAWQYPSLGSVVGKRPLGLLAERMILAADDANNVAGQPHEAQIRIHPVVG